MLSIFCTITVSKYSPVIYLQYGCQTVLNLGQWGKGLYHKAALSYTQMPWGCTSSHGSPECPVFFPWLHHVPYSRSCETSWGMSWPHWLYFTQGFLYAGRIPGCQLGHFPVLLAFEKNGTKELNSGDHGRIWPSGFNYALKHLFVSWKFFSWEKKLFATLSENERTRWVNMLPSADSCGRNGPILIVSSSSVLSRPERVCLHCHETLDWPVSADFGWQGSGYGAV